MNLNPFSAVRLKGNSTMRGVIVPLPTEQVRNFLPAGLELGDQTVTSPKTHPVMYFFNDIFRAHISIPTLIPNMTYHEHQIGVPFTYLSDGPVTSRSGPYYFMPKLYLDNLLAIVGGIAGWGFAKEMASFSVDANHYIVTSLTGQRLASLDYTPKRNRGFRPVAQYPSFEPIRQILSQKLISMVPASIGPFFVLSDFDKAFDDPSASVEPIQTTLDVDVAYVQGLKCGRQTPAPGLESWELKVPWSLSLPYPPLLASLASGK
jgi:hypothetical protein